MNLEQLIFDISIFTAGASIGGYATYRYILYQQKKKMEKMQDQFGGMFGGEQ